MPGSSSIPETVDIAPSHPGSPILTKVSAHSPQSCSSDHFLTPSIPSPRVITPTDLVTTPTVPVETPIDALITPIDALTTPIDAVTTPIEVVPTPTDLVATPTGVVATPTDVVATPAIATPTDDITTPTDNVITPTDVAITPTEMVTTSTAEVVGAEVNKTNQQKTALAIRPLQKRIVLKKVSKEVEGMHLRYLILLLVCAQIYIGHLLLLIHVHLLFVNW